MKIVVTGHKGYVGSALFHELYMARFDPVGFDIADGPDGDITQPKVRDKIAELNPDIVYNLAGVSGEAACRKDQNSAQVNAYAPAQLAEATQAVFIQASSASVLAARGIETPYANQKLLAEGLLRRAARDRAYILRFATVLGFNYNGPTRWDTPANSMARSAVRERKIVVNGPDLMRPWVSLEILVSHLMSYATRFRSWTWEFPIPIASDNMSLGEMAQLIGLYRPGCEKILNPPGADSRDYTMPALLGRGYGVNWSIRALVEHA